jgi:hypothetical protein
MKTRVYVAGPITKPKGRLQAKIDMARAAGLALLRAGYSPMVPHLTCFFASNEPEILPAGTVHEDWYSVDLPWVAVSQAVLRLPGESRGADLETDLAFELDIPVYYDLPSLLASLPSEAL